MQVRVIRFSSMGDCILLCPFLEHLKRHGAEKVSIITRREYVELFAAARGVDRVIGLEARSGWRGLRQLITANRREEGVLIDAHDTMRSRLVSRGLGGADARIDKNYFARVALILFKRAASLPTMGQRFSELGERIGFPPMETHAGGIDVPDGAREQARRWLDPDGDVPAKRVALAPGGRWAMKRWREEHFVELARRIADNHDAQLVLLGDDGDTAVNMRIASVVGDQAVDVTGKTGIMEAAAVLERCDAFIGNDSGLMHLAEAVGTPVLALFGPTVKSFGYYPTRPDSKVIERDIACRPCSRNGSRRCPLGTQECLTKIPVDPVEAAFEDLIAGRGPSRYVLS